MQLLQCISSRHDLRNFGSLIGVYIFTPSPSMRHCLSRFHSKRDKYCRVDLDKLKEISTNFHIFSSNTPNFHYGTSYHQIQDALPLPAGSRDKHSGERSLLLLRKGAYATTIGQVFEAQTGMQTPWLHQHMTAKLIILCTSCSALRNGETPYFRLCWGYHCCAHCAGYVFPLSSASPN